VGVVIMKMVMTGVTRKDINVLHKVPHMSRFRVLKKKLISISIFSFHVCTIAKFFILHEFFMNSFSILTHGIKYLGYRYLYDYGDNNNVYNDEY
jgi:hypothetical protein